MLLCDSETSMRPADTYDVTLDILAPKYCCLDTMNSEKPMESEKLVLAQAER